MVAGSWLEAEGRATALEVLGPDAGYALAVDLDLAVLFLVRGDDGTITARSTDRFAALTAGSNSASALE